jgi:hypothetical protein
VYAMDPNDKKSFEITKEPYQLTQYQFMNSVKENWKFLSPREKIRAKRARDLFIAMGTATFDDLKAIIMW